MNTLTKNPAARGSASRARSLVCSATNGSEIIPSPREIQLAFIARRFGLAPIRAALIAAICFQTEAPR